jgi:hypothetical protein
MGGLVARYVIGLLNERGFKVRSENIEDAANVPVYIPLSFMTISSPHLGVDRAVRGCITAAWNCVGGSLCCYRSTKQLFIKDPETLLNNMAQPQSSFLNGLLQFQHRTLVGHRQE